MEEVSISAIEIIPQVLFVVLICAITVIAIVDYEQVVESFEIFVDWVKERPELA